MAGKSKNPSKSTTNTSRRKSLKQTRLAGINHNVKSIRSPGQTTPFSPIRWKQPVLASFGFLRSPREKQEEKRDDPRQLAKERDQSGKKRKLSPHAEIPETQFALLTQSSDDGSRDRKNSIATGDRSEVGTKVENKGEMLPSPITPRKRKVVEVPSSHSPPASPLSPYRSQRQRAGSSQSPTPVKRVKRAKEGVPGGRLERMVAEVDEVGRTPIKYEPKRRVEEKEPLNRGRVEVKSSQWWENEDGHLSTQAPPVAEETRKEKKREDYKLEWVEEEERQEEGEVKRRHMTEEKSWDGGNRHDSDETLSKLSSMDFPSVWVDLSYKNAPPPTKPERGLEEKDIPESQHVQGTERKATEDDEHTDDGGEELFHSAKTSFQPDYNTQHHDDNVETPLPHPSSGGYNEEYDDFDEEFATEFKPVRTQQLPSSFYFPPSTPDLPPSSQPTIRSHSKEASESEPEPLGAQKRVFVVNNESGNRSKGPRRIEVVEKDWGDVDVTNDENAIRDGNKSEDRRAEEIVSDTEDEEPPIDIDVGGDDERRDSITMSQLLPDTLMETFPMPPSLTQFNSSCELQFRSQTQ